MAPTARRIGKVARVQLEPPSQGDLYTSPREAALAAFVPGTSTSRYNRTWLMGQSRIEQDEFLVGRIGFEADGGVAEVWDSGRQDFTEVAIPSGVTSQFVIDLRDLTMVFQTRGSIIKVNSFIGAMQALLRESTGQDWTLVTSQRKINFEDWRASVDRITRIRFHIERPNPNYEGRPDVKRLLEGTNAVAGTFELQNPDGLATDGEIVEQLLQHVLMGYGDASVVGQRDAEGRIVDSLYETRLQGESELHELPADEHGDVPVDELRRELTGDRDAAQSDEHG